MYCGQCGKRIMENMLFCPFCGSPIVIPDQDGAPVAAPERAPMAERPREAPAAAEPVEATPAETQAGEERGAEAPGRDASRTESAETDRPVSLFDEIPAEEPHRDKDAFIPLSFEEETPGENRRAEDLEIVSAKVEVESAPPESRPSRRPAPREFRRPESARRRAAQTYIPVKDVDLEDIFMDGAGEEDDYDDYDLDESDARDRVDFDFEEPERGGFLQRHVRGVVGLALLLILLAICVVWAFSSKGQRTLAKANLAWTAQPYADLGYEAYRQDSDRLAARYYEKALERDETNYEYAHSAMVAYYEAEDIPSAAAMLKKCIAMNPDSPEPYQELMILYPDAQTRPWEIQELIRQGYERTGNAALKQD